MSAFGPYLGRRRATLTYTLTLKLFAFYPHQRRSNTLLVRSVGFLGHTNAGVVQTTKERLSVALFCAEVVVVVAGRRENELGYLKINTVRVREGRLDLEPTHVGRK